MSAEAVPDSPRAIRLRDGIDFMIAVALANESSGDYQGHSVVISTIAIYPRPGCRVVLDHLGKKKV